MGIETHLLEIRPHFGLISPMTDHKKTAKAASAKIGSMPSSNVEDRQPKLVAGSVAKQAALRHCALPAYFPAKECCIKRATGARRVQKHKGVAKPLMVALSTIMIDELGAGPARGS